MVNECEPVGGMIVGRGTEVFGDINANPNGSNTHTNIWSEYKQF
jgi:hypothetical protein